MPISLTNPEWRDYSETDLVLVVDQFLNRIQFDLAREGGVVFFHGPLGAGKSTWVRTLIRRWIPNADFRGSPSFPILHEYLGASLPVYHLDLYRLKDEHEIFESGIESHLYENPGITLIEWPEVLPEWSAAIELNPPLGKTFHVELALATEGSADGLAAELVDESASSIRRVRF